MKVLILGSDTHVGRALGLLLSEADITFDGVAEQGIDWTEKVLNALLLNHQPDYIINTHMIESQGDVLLAGIANKLQMPLIQLASNSIYAAEGERIYSEDDEANAQESLAALEQEILHKAYRHIVLRTGWLLGQEDDLLAAILNLVRHQVEVVLPELALISPTPAEDVARVILALFKQSLCSDDLWGVYHYTAVEAISPKDFAQVLAAEACQYEEIAMKDLTTGESDLPQLVGGQLSGKKIMHTFGVQPRSWRNALSNYLKNEYQRVE
jgi:dTDP-4-dehydrorhamnose reductase